MANKRIKDLATTKYKGFMALDDADGTGKMDVGTIFNNFAGKFVPSTEPNPTTTIAGLLYIYNGSLYRAKEAYQGPWDASKFTQVNVSTELLLKIQMVKQAIESTTEKDVDVILDCTKNDGGYINAAGVLVESAPWHYYELDVIEGQIYDIRSSSGIAAVGYVFLNSDDAVVSYESPTPSDISVRWMRGVVAPIGAVKMIMNTNDESVFKVIRKYGNLNVAKEVWAAISEFANAGFMSAGVNGDVKKVNLSALFGVVEKKFDDISNWTKVENHFYQLTGSTANNSWDYYVRDVVPGQNIYLESYAGSAARLWIFLDENDNVVAYSDHPDVAPLTASVVVPNKAAKIISNHRKDATYKFVANIIGLVISEGNLDLRDVVDRADVATEKMSFADVVTKSVLLESTETDGGYLQTDGTVNANVNWHMYSLNVKEGQVFDIQSSSGIEAKAYIFLDVDDNVVGYEENAPSSISSRWVYGVIVPSGAVRMVVNTNSTTIEILIHYGTPNHKFVNYGGVASFTEKASIFSDSLGKEIRFNISSFFGYNTKDFTEDLTNWTLVEGKFYNRNTNTEVSNASWNYYQKSVVAGETYKVTAAAGSAAPLWIIKDYNGKIISASNIADIGNNTETFVVPYGAATIICNSRINSGDTPFVAAKKEIVIDAKNLDLSSENKSRNILYGKTLVCCGDSITYGADIGDEGIVATPTIEMYQRVGSSFESVTANARASYGYQIAAANSMKFYNDGVGGSCVESLPDEPPSGFSMENGRYTTLPNDIDYLTLWFGWNDYAYGSLGTITDNVRTTFYGAYNIVLPYLINKYPFTKICLCVPYGTSADMRQAVRNLGNKWGLAVFDFYGPQTPLYWGKEASVGVEESIAASNRAKFQATSAHPNFRGQTQISNMLEAFLRTI